jgi:hypothetical protein
MQSDINRLEIAEGLKQLLFSKGCDLNFLLKGEPASLVQQLGIDEYVAGRRRNKREVIVVSYYATYEIFIVL